MKKIILLASLAFSINAIAQVPSYVPANGLVGYWPFTSNANDQSGNGNNGTVTAATLTTDRFGNINTAYYFNGNANIQTLIPTNLSPSASSFYSFSVWFNTDSIAVSKIILAYNTAGNTSNYDIMSSHSNCTLGSIAVQNYPFNNPSACSPSTVNTNNWTHLYIVFDQVADTFAIYKNSQFWFDGLIGNSSPISGYLNFGNTSPSGIFGYKGKIDDIGVWNRALTTQEISDLYNGNICYQYITVTDTLLINTTLTGFNPVTYQNTIKIYPNPTNDHITIDNGNIANLTGYQIKITNSLSQQVFQSAITQQQFYVDLSTWTGNGIYFVHIIDGQGNTIDIKKIVLQ